MNESHTQKGHGLKPEAEKRTPSKRRKTNSVGCNFLCRRDTEHLAASGFNPWRLCVCVSLAVFACAVPVHAASASQPVTVKDYFLRLPARYFEVPKALRERTYFGRGSAARTEVLDIKNDYMSVAGDGAQPPLTVALFRYRGTVTVAVWDSGYDPETPTLDFLRYRNGHWFSVTPSVLPLPFDNRLAYFLPRRGTTIRVCNSRGRTVYNLLWRQGRFRLGLPQ